MIAELEKVDREIDVLYWHFSRRARAKPPVVARPDLYERRAELEQAINPRTRRER